MVATDQQLVQVDRAMVATDQQLVQVDRAMVATDQPQDLQDQVTVEAVTMVAETEEEGTNI